MIDWLQFNDKLCNIHTQSAWLILSKALIEYRLEGIVKFTMDIEQQC